MGSLFEELEAREAAARVGITPKAAPAACWMGLLTRLSVGGRVPGAG